MTIQDPSLLGLSSFPRTNLSRIALTLVDALQRIEKTDAVVVWAGPSGQDGKYWPPMITAEIAQVKRFFLERNLACCQSS